MKGNDHRKCAYLGKPPESSKKPKSGQNTSPATLLLPHTDTFGWKPVLTVFTMSGKPAMF